MKLARLELSGFKSFADYTEFLFDDGITGIVGPNGCGKSNVVDAIKWVLGEMSARSLRGDAMLDVIFSGSGSRKPMGMAEVSLTFTNEDHRLPLDNPTVKVTRRLYRDGTSEYLVNNGTARLKDIRELFLDTGVGVDAYSLIEQGRVAALLEANTQDRREIFEEAAGISRFKLRKKETARKLEKTEQNLAQSKLVLEEVEKQLRSIKLQAGKARNYQEYAARLRELRSASALHEYDQLHGKLRQLSAQRETLLDMVEETNRQLAAKRALQQDAQLELDGLQESMRSHERALLAAEAQCQSARQQEGFARRQIESLAIRQRQQGQLQAELAQRHGEQSAAAATAQAALADMDAALAQHELLVTEAVSRQEQAAKAIALLARTLDEKKSAAVELLRQIARVNNELNGQKITLENLSHQRQRLGERQGQLAAALEDLAAKEQQQSAEKASLEQEQAAAQEQLAAVRQQQEATNQRHAQVSEQLARQRELRSGLQSRRSVLQDLQARREGVSQAAREVLKARDAGAGFAGVRALVADLFTTNVEHALAVEAALGELQNALVADLPTIAAEEQLWRELPGRAMVLSADAPATSDAPLQCPPQGAIALSELVQAAPGHEQLAAALLPALFGRTLLVENLTVAAELSRGAPAGCRFVTAAGEVVEAGGPWVLGDMAKRGGVISRRSELLKLEGQLEAVEREVNASTAQLAECDSSSRQLHARQQELRDVAYTRARRIAELNAQWQGTQQQIQRARAEAPLLQQELETIDRNGELQRQRQVESTEKLGALEAQAKGVEKEVHELSGQMIVQQHAVSELSEAATQARVTMGQVREQRAAKAREAGQLRQAAAQLETQLAGLDADAQAVAAQLAEANETLETAGRAAAQQEQAAAAAQEQLAALGASAGQMRAQLETVQAALADLQRQSQEQSQEETALSMACNEASVRIETLITHTQEELQIDLPERHRTYEAAELNLPAIAEEVADLRGRIARLGNVNLDAIDQQQQLEERHAFLTAQLADIAEAQRQLQELIEKINADSHERFVATFNAVRAEFQDMFRKLFGGGKADVILENPDDVLESGIEILARPPGKELQSISLLSGGEKTMTAVALVLSIFKTKPSPFCVLDEVDAALDEANTGRFASIVQEFLAHSQFIVITHNKRTMSIANVLYGVTMQEQGVSKRVAVQFDGRAAAAGRPLQPAGAEAATAAA